MESNHKKNPENQSMSILIGAVSENLKSKFLVYASLVVNMKEGELGTIKFVLFKMRSIPPLDSSILHPLPLITKIYRRRSLTMKKLIKMDKLPVIFGSLPMCPSQ